MRKPILAAALSLLATGTFAQTDSSAFYLQKALDEKAKGRRMEVVKNLEKAYGYNKNDLQVVTELGNAYFSVNFLTKAKEKFLQAESLGDKSPATYKQLMNLNFNMRQWNDAVKYALAFPKSSSS